MDWAICPSRIRLSCYASAMSWASNVCRVALGFSGRTDLGFGGGLRAERVTHLIPLGEASLGAEPHCSPQQAWVWMSVLYTSIFYVPFIHLPPDFN